MINLSGIPERVMLDSSVLTRTREGSTMQHSALCLELFQELLRRGHRVLIPAVALAEYMRRPPHDQPRRHRNIEVVAFDQEAAVALATRLPTWPTIREQTGASRTVAKYDEMILGSAIRHNAGVLFCMDNDLLDACRLAGVVGTNPLSLVVQMTLDEALARAPTQIPSSASTSAGAAAPPVESGGTQDAEPDEQTLGYRRLDI